MTTTRLPESRCPECHAFLDSASPVNDEEEVTAQAGDITICVICGAKLWLTERLLLEPLPLDVFNELPEADRHRIEQVSHVAKELAKQREQHGVKPPRRPQ